MPIITDVLPSNLATVSFGARGDALLNVHQVSCGAGHGCVLVSSNRAVGFGGCVGLGGRAELIDPLWLNRAAQICVAVRAAWICVRKGLHVCMA